MGVWEKVGEDGGVEKMNGSMLGWGKGERWGRWNGVGKWGGSDVLGEAWKGVEKCVGV